MTPLDQILMSDWTPLLSVLCAAALVIWTWRQIRRYHQDRLDAYREDHRIPAAERALVGDDYRDLVRPYFHGDRFAARYRRDRAVAETCLPPEKTEAAAVGRPASLTAKERTCGRTAA